MDHSQQPQSQEASHPEVEHSRYFNERSSTPSPQNNAPNETEQALRREMQLTRHINSIRDLGYDLSTVDRNRTITLCSAATGDIQRLLYLIELFHLELDRLMPVINERSALLAEDWTLKATKEHVVGGLLAQILPAMGGLSERVGRQAAESMALYGGGVKFHVG